MPANPCSRLRKRGVENRETRVLSEAEIKQLWRRAVVAPVSRRVGLALRLVLLTSCRASEVAGISRAELHDLTEPERQHGCCRLNDQRTAGPISSRFRRMRCRQSVQRLSWYLMMTSSFSRPPSRKAGRLRGKR